MNIYLTGFMGAGKTAVGRALARRLRGGTLLRRSNRALVRRTGVLVSLSCSEAELWSRLRRGGGARPLLGPEPGRRGRMRRLLAARRDLYRDADATVSTSGRTPRQAAARIAALL